MSEKKATSALDKLLSGLQAKLMNNDRKKRIQQFETFYFQLFPEYSEVQIQQILAGRTTAPVGLCGTAGLYSRSKGTFKTAACRALSLIQKLVEAKTNPQHWQDFASAITKLPPKALNAMRLSEHLTDPGGNASSARVIEALLKGPEKVNPIRNVTSVSVVTEVSEPVKQKEVTAQGKQAVEKYVRPGFFARLQNFITTRPSTEALEKKGLLKKAAVFGNSFQDLREGNKLDSAGVPFVFKALIDELRRRGATSEPGLFRESGSSLEIGKLKRSIDFNEQYDLKLCHHNSLAGLTKLFLRELPQPLLTFELYDAFVSAYKVQNWETLRKLEASLPPAQLATWNYFLQYLVEVNTLEGKNLMTTKNIAVVISPNVLRPRVETLQNIQSDTPSCIGCVEFALTTRRKNANIILASDLPATSFYSRLFGPPSETCNGTPSAAPVTPSAAPVTPSAAPVTPSAAPVTQSPIPAASNAPLPALSLPPPPQTLHPDWREYEDPASGRKYYANVKTQERTWNFPEASSSVPDDSESDDEADARALQQIRAEREEDEKNSSVPAAESKTKVTEASLDNFQPAALDDVFDDEDEKEDPVIVPRLQMLQSSCSQPLAFWERLIDPRSQREYFHCPPERTEWKLPEDVDVSSVVTRSKSVLRPKWCQLQVDGSWEQSTAGGCFPNFGTWRKNPQYRVMMKPQQDQTRTAECTVQLKWEWDGPPPAPPPGKTRPRHPAIGLYVVRNDGPCQELTRITPETTVGRSQFKTSGELSCSFEIIYHEPRLDSFVGLDAKSRADWEFPVHYTIIPSTYEPNVLGSFKLTVHCSSEIAMLKVRDSEKWLCESVSSEWKGATAGGCRNNAASWAKNPKFELKSSIAQLMTVVLRQDGQFSNNLAPEPIGFYCIDNKGEVTKPGGYASSLEVVSQLEFNPAQAPYMIVPCTFDAGRERPFRLSVYAPGAFTLSKT
jgi:hypothetical protein